MENNIILKIDLPQETISALQSVIIETVRNALYQHVTDIKTEPKMYTRKEAAAALRITLPTLRVYEVQGRLIPKRAGKSVLYTKEILEAFIASLRQ